MAANNRAKIAAALALGQTLGPNAAKIIAAATLDWDPYNCKEPDTMSPTAAARLRRDLSSLFSDPPFGIFVTADENNMRYIHVIIVGNAGTPYEGGFFYFFLKIPNNYPISPPKVKLLTTDAGRVRFNTNLYSNGKVCLSILGTSTGPEWSPVQRISSLLISIQSIMSENPYFNEPFNIKGKTLSDSKKYNDLVTYQTFRVAICGMLENECSLNIPANLREMMERTFLEGYEHYVDMAESNIHLNGTKMNSIIMFPNEFTGYEINYTKILERMKKLQEKLNEKYATKTEGTVETEETKP